MLSVALLDVVGGCVALRSRGLVEGLHVEPGFSGALDDTELVAVPCRSRHE